jgi:serine/threonine protein kinase
MTPKPAPSSSTDTLSDLLLRWRELREQGKPCGAEDLCRDRPDLLNELREHIGAVEAMERVFCPDVRNTLPLDGPIHLAPSASIPGYEILQEIGRGGMGVVYKARQKSLNRLVALKMILGGGHAAAQQLARFKAEAEALGRLHHENIVQVHEIGEHDGLPFLSLEYVEGGSLEKHLSGKPLLPREAAALIETLARAIHAAHVAGVVHRDLKPANILLAKSAIRTPTSARKTEVSASDFEFRISDLEPKVTDFGLAKMLDVEGHTRSGAVMGTPCYMAPEQAEGRIKDVGPVTDVYALGTILYELLTGTPPFKGDSALEVLMQVKSVDPIAPSRLKPRTPRDLETICLKCLRKEPSKRYTTAGELAGDLRRFLDGRPITARKVSMAERGFKWMRRRPERAALLGLFLLALPVLAILFWPRPKPPDTPEPSPAPAARAVLLRYCFPCHGQDRKNIEKDLDILDHALLTDPAKKYVVPGDVKSSLLIKRIDDNSMPPVEEETYPRLNSDDIDDLKKWVRAGAPAFPGPQKEDYIVPQPDPLAVGVVELLEQKCAKCHSTKSAKGGIKILNHDLLLVKRGLVVPGRPDDSLLLQALMRKDDDRKKRMPPPPAPRLGDQDINLVRNWIKAGAPPFPHPSREP